MITTTAFKLLRITGTSLVIALLSACGGGGGDSGPPVTTSYQVSTSAGSGGSISPASLMVNAGGTTSLTVTPNTGYTIGSVTGCGGTLYGTTFTTAPVAVDCEVDALFAIEAAEIVFRKEIQEAKDKKAKRAEMVALYREAFSNPYVAAGRRLVDAVIDPAETRRHVSQALEYLQTKRELRPPKKHGLMPL